MKQTKINTLIVDDNREFCFILNEFLLTQKDIIVSGVANDGMTALNLIKELEPDLLVLDMIMPCIDGLGVLEELRKKDYAHNIKIIVLSAAGQDKITQRALELGADYYIIKPFDMQVFIQRIRQLFNDITRNERFKETINLTQSDEVKLGKNNICDLEQQITNVMHEIGIPAHIKGYQFVREAISLTFNDRNLTSVTKELYPLVAEKYNTTSARVERAIRHAIEVAWLRGKEDAKIKLFRCGAHNDKAKPTNSEFISTVAEVLRLKNNTNLL